MNAAEKKGLFARDALEAQAYRRSGEPAAAYPVTLTRLTWGGVAVTALAVAALFAIPYTQYRQAFGEVESTRGIHVETAGQSGTLHLAKGWPVGTWVSAGTRLGELRTSPAAISANSISDDGVELLERKRDSMEAARKLEEAADDTRATAADTALVQIGHAGAALQAELEAVRARLKLKQQEAERFENLAQKGYVSPQYLAGLTGEIAGLRATEANVAGRLATHGQEAAGAKASAANARSQQRLGKARREQDLNELRSRIAAAHAANLVVLKAGISGRIVALHANEGQSVAVGDPVVSIQPDDSLGQVVCRVNARLAAHLAPGDRIRVNFDDYPHLIYGGDSGTVLSIEQAPTLRPRPGDASASASARYRVRLSLQGERHADIALIAGMPVTIEFPLATHRLADWLFLSAASSRRPAND